MPELPDVETVADRLRRTITGQRIIGVRVPDHSTIRSPRPRLFIKRLTGRSVRRVDRRGKYLLVRLNPPATLAVHLRMTGDLQIVSPTTPVDRHTRVVVRFDGLDLRFIDQRRFGHMDLVSAEGEFEPVARLGIEPLAPSFTKNRWEAILRRRRGSIKSLLLRQDLVAGIGNIYADEILWKARVHPAQSVDRLRRKEVIRLHQTIRRVLSHAVTSLVQHGRYMGRFLQIRDKKNARCPRCRRPIISARIAGRTTYFCSHCQRRGGRGRALKSR